jgi:hypothetical protein
MIAFALALFSALGPTQDPKPIPADLAKEIERAESIGRVLFNSDQAAWHASDGLAAAKGPLEKLGLGGFLAKPGPAYDPKSPGYGRPGGSWTVLFLSAGEPTLVLHLVIVNNSGNVPHVLDTPTPLPLSKEDAALWAARQLAIEKGGPYEQPINPVVLRGSDFGETGILVYLLGGSQKPDVAVLGRHVRVRVSDDGTKVIEVLPLVKGIIESPTKSVEGKPVAALMASQVVTDFPTEVQVFAQLNAGLPLFVATRRGLWKVEQGKVAYLGEKPPAKATLKLALREREGGAAREGALQLWRVGIPAEPGYTEGDEYTGDFRVPATGLEIPDLVPGKYRALCEAHAGSAPEFAVFEVKGPRTELALEVVAPRERAAFVELVDVKGVAFESAEYMPSGRSGMQRLPAWLHPRSKLAPDGSSLQVGAGGGTVSNSSDRSWRKLKRGEHGFALGPDLEDGSLFETTRGFQLRVPGHGTVSGSLSCAGHEELRYRMLLVEKGSLEGLFKLPDGSPLDLQRLSIDTPLEPDVLPRPADWWLDVPIRITIAAPGCQRLVLEHRLRDGRPRPRKLEKSP